MKVLQHDQFLLRIDWSRKLIRRKRRFIEFVSQEDNVSHQFHDSLSIFSDDSNDARTVETNEADEDHTTAPMVPIDKKIPLALRRLKDFNVPVTNW